MPDVIDNCGRGWSSARHAGRGGFAGRWTSPAKINTAAIPAHRALARLEPVVMDTVPDKPKRRDHAARRPLAPLALTPRPYPSPRRHASLPRAWLPARHAPLAPARSRMYFLLTIIQPLFFSATKKIIATTCCCHVDQYHKVVQLFTVHVLTCSELWIGFYVWVLQTKAETEAKLLWLYFLK